MGEIGPTGDLLFLHFAKKKSKMDDIFLPKKKKRRKKKKAAARLATNSAARYTRNRFIFRVALSVSVCVSILFSSMSAGAAMQTNFICADSTIPIVYSNSPAGMCVYGSTTANEYVTLHGISGLIYLCIKGCAY